MKIENLHREGLDFVVEGKAKDGVPPTEHIKAGETADLDIPDTEGARAQIAARVAAGMIKVSGAGAKAVAAAAPETGTTATSGKSR